MNLVNIVAASARDASPFGTSVLAVRPVIKPFVFTHSIPSSAQLDTLSRSV